MAVVSRSHRNYSFLGFLNLNVALTDCDSVVSQTWGYSNLNCQLAERTSTWSVRLVTCFEHKFGGFFIFGEGGGGGGGKCVHGSLVKCAFLCLHSLGGGEMRTCIRESSSRLS